MIGKRITRLWGRQLQNASGETLEQAIRDGLAEEVFLSPELNKRLTAHNREKYPEGTALVCGLSHEELCQVAASDPAPLLARGWTIDDAGELQPPADMAELRAEWERAGPEP